MTIRKTMLAALVLTLPAAGASAQQEPWTLARCIEYAVENNISIQQFRLRAEDQDVKLNTARNSRLPNLNAGLGGSFGFGRTIGENNTYENVNQFSSNLSVSTSIPLFNGMRIKHDIAAQKLSLQAAMQDGRAREDVSLNVTALYLRRCSTKSSSAWPKAVALSMAQIERSRLLVDSGKSPESELYESRALLAKDSLTLTQARNTLTLSLLDLSQALNREDATGFDIRMPELGTIQIGAMSSMESPSVIYEYAVGNRPSVQAEKYRLQNSEKNLLLARSARYPQISLGASYGTSYFHIFGNEAMNASFGNQFRNYGSESVGLNVSIPIFNRMATRNNIRSARIAIRNQELALTEARQALRKEIEQSYYNAGAAYQKYLSASRSLEAAREAFRYEEEKSAAGRSTIFDYNDAKTRMERSESELVQAKFEFIFRRKILDFYAGEPLGFEKY
ncbi:MAG: TolC family protein [Alistipes ihumii]